MIAVIVWTAVGLGLLAAMFYSLPLMRDLRTFLDRGNRLLDRTNDRFDPIVNRLERLTEEAGEVAGSLRRDADRIESAVDEGTRSARRIARLAENRVAEIDALLEVAQEEAESSFVSAASLVGGVRDLRERLFRRR